MTTTIKKAWPAQLRTVARGMANDTADYQPPIFHTGADGAHVTTLTLHDRAGETYDGHPTMQLTVRGGDGGHNLERLLQAALDAVRAGRVVR